MNGNVVDGIEYLNAPASYGPLIGPVTLYITGSGVTNSLDTILDLDVSGNTTTGIKLTAITSSDPPYEGYHMAVYEYGVFFDGTNATDVEVIPVMNWDRHTNYRVGISRTGGSNVQFINNITALGTADKDVIYKLEISPIIR